MTLDYRYLARSDRSRKEIDSGLKRLSANPTLRVVWQEINAAACRFNVKFNAANRIRDGWNHRPFILSAAANIDMMMFETIYIYVFLK